MKKKGSKTTVNRLEPYPSRSRKVENKKKEVSIFEAKKEREVLNEENRTQLLVTQLQSG